MDRAPTIRIAGGAGFWGDWTSAPRRLVEAERVDYLTLEYLAELTLSILARQREKDPAAGYATDLLSVIDSLVPALVGQPQLKVVTNGGGMNPPACAAAVGRRLVAAGLAELPIGVVTGDDLLPRFAALMADGWRAEHFDTGEPFPHPASALVSINAYLGAEPIAAALAERARVVITGRVADASLTLGPALHAFGWSLDDWPRLAAATVAGHVIECGAQATGGFHTFWNELDLTEVGYPIAELTASGAVSITKAAGSGGAVNRQTVAEQLIYEIGDPAHYLTPDVDVDFTQLTLEPLAVDRVAIRGARGGPPPDTLKVSLAYRAGYTASGQLLVYGTDCIAKARACAELALGRLKADGVVLAQTHVELLGSGAGVPGVAPPPLLREVVLRITACDPRRETVEQFANCLVPLATSGPAGLAGYTQARGSVRPVFAYWPTRIPRGLIAPQVDVRSAGDWGATT